MILFPTLYIFRRLVDRKVAMYCSALNWIAANRASGDLAGVRTNMNQATLAFRTVTDPFISKYLLATDPVGAEVFICNLSTDTPWVNQWNQIVAGGFQAAAANGFQTFNIVAASALAIWNDLKTQITTTTPLFLSGHGICSIIAKCVAMLALAQGYQPANLYALCPCYGFKPPIPQNAEDYIKAICILGDPAIWVPPSNLWNPLSFFPDNPPLSELVEMRGITLTVPREDANSLELTVNTPIDRVATALNWPTFVANTLNSFDTVTPYLNRAYPGSYMANIWRYLSNLDQQLMQGVPEAMTAFGWTLAYKPI